MPDAQRAMVGLQAGADVLFLLVGALLAFAMLAGFAFREAGTVRHKNQVSALCKSLIVLAVSVVAYFVVGYSMAYGGSFFTGAGALSGGDAFGPQGLSLARFVFLAMIAAMAPAIVSGGIAERARLMPQCAAAAFVVALVYPVIEGIVWNRNGGIQEGLFKAWLGAEFHDFAGSVVVHAVGGWLAFAAVRRLGPRLGRYEEAREAGLPHSSMPWVALGCWLMCVGLFGFNVARVPSVQSISGLVAVNCLMALCGGILAALIAGDGDAGFIHNGALAGLVAISAGSDVVHPVGALFIGGVAGIVLVYGLRAAADPKWQFDDALGVWALHGVCGVWGSVACGVFGLTVFGGMGGVSLPSQIVGSVLGAAFALAAGIVAFAAIDALFGFRVSAEDERRGADLAVHRIGANPQDAHLGRV